MKKKKAALLNSLLALLLCFTMLLGTTYAWFTDSVTSTNNLIQAGNLDIELEYWDEDNAKWKTVKSDTSLFEESTLWEPGYTQVVYLRAANKGTLALKYQLGINIVDETEGIRFDKETGKDVSFKLSDSIYMGVKEGVNGEDNPYATREAAVADVETVGTDIISTGFSKSGEMNAGDGEQYLAVVVYMPTSVGNEANHKTGTTPPKITLGIKVVATQKDAEMDSFGDDYDVDAEYPGMINFSASAAVTADANGALDQDVTIGETDDINADIPAGVKLAEGATELKLSVETMLGSEANVELNNGETMQSLDIHIEGVAEDNTVPMLITIPGLLKKGLNEENVKLYHVEDGVTVSMVPAANPVAHNEFHYDPATGDVTVALSSFSEVATVADVTASWDGAAATDFNSGSGTEGAPYVIANASQLAYFRNQVDKGETFAGQYIKLEADIDLCGVNFDPIGYGYDYAAYNEDEAKGKTFNGIFDGQGHTISGLYQNGWELGYSYTNCGGGLFASVCDATIKNLTISGADITMECVEMGVLVGLSQGTCNYSNINICGSKIANYQRATGGVVGEVSPQYDDNGNVLDSVHNFTDVTVDSNTTVGSLWGDFDAPVGGVIGARWDDGDTTKVNMTNVAVACKLDVYNDVTSTYQWYAYRRAGMLIGNTDTPPADGKNSKVATANFLTCSNVKVYYGDWVDYHYCEFSNHNASWPWVRVEAGENCSSYSNPRYGVPNDINGNKVVDKNHVHQTGDTCMESIPFNQLYGGGQGVYGAESHSGVEVVTGYSVTYMDRGGVYKVDCWNNATEYTVDHTEDVPERENYSFKAWVNAGGSKVESIPAGNTMGYVLYDSWNGIFTARFVDQDGNVIYEEEFEEGQSELVNEPTVPAIDGEFSGAWEPYDLASATGDITIKPVYTYEGQLQLTPVDSSEPPDGITDYYRVDATKALTGEVEVPGVINNVPVVVVQDLCYGDDFSNINQTLTKVTFNEGVTRIEANAVAYTTALAEVELPSTLEYIGANAFASVLGSVGGAVGAKQKITFTYNGTCADWEKLDSKSDPKWDNELVVGSVIVCDDGYYVLESTTYLGYGTTKWAKHPHVYGTDCVDGCPQ